MVLGGLLSTSSSTPTLVAACWISGSVVGAGRGSGGDVPSFRSCATRAYS